MQAIAASSQSLVESAPIRAAALDVARAAEKIDMRCLHELRSFRHPPTAICQVMEAVLAVLGLPETGWAAIRRRLDANFLQSITAFDAAAAAECPRAQVDRFLGLLQDRDFGAAALEAKCPAAAPLVDWCSSAVRLLRPLHGSPPAGAVAVTSAAAPSAAGARRPRASGPRARQRPPAVAQRRGGPTRPPASAGAAGRDAAVEAAGSGANAAPVLAAGAGQPSGVATGGIEAPLALGGLLVEPQLWKCSEAELACVEDLRISRAGVGQVTFHGLTDCRGLLPLLPDIIVIEQGEVVVYPETCDKPPVGLGLNKPASIVLYGCMPKMQTRLSSPRSRDRYKQRVAQMTESKGAIFEGYDCEDGTWRFRVHHF